MVQALVYYTSTVGSIPTVCNLFDRSSQIFWDLHCALGSYTKRGRDNLQAPKLTDYQAIVLVHSLSAMTSSTASVTPATGGVEGTGLTAVAVWRGALLLVVLT